MINEDGEFLLRVWQIEDATAAFEFYGDAEVSKYIGNGKPAKDVEQVRRHLQIFISHQAEYGFSPWAVIEKETNQIIGICGLHTFNEYKNLNLGFEF